MVCPHCRTPNPEGTSICVNCSTPIAADDATLLVTNPQEASAAGGSTWARPATPFENVGQITLQPRTLLAGRYEIVQLLGAGGMGAVYRAHDRELEREVALKVIRPELASNAVVLARFKQELILARKVTHRNIIRIFDLGSGDGMRFITMEFIEGQDLAQILAQRGKLPGHEAAAIVAQVARGLDAAHAEGVVHRDLKPQNVMVDVSGRCLVMDFGIARSMDASKMTRTGAVMGTPTYMSPEQAQGTLVDARSDLYALGVIFYELITGKLPFEADNPMATLVKRIQEKPRPPVEIEPAIAAPVNEIVLKMLATAPEERYQSAGELLAAIDAYEAQRTGRTQMTVAPAGPRVMPISYVAAAMLFLVALGVWLYSRKGTVPAGPAAPVRVVKVLVADFQNGTNEPVFDGTLEPTLALAMEGASFISSFSRGQARKAAAQRQPGFTQLDEKLARLVAESEGIDVVISGGINPAGGGYQLRARALDGFTGKLLIEKSEAAGKKADVLLAAGKLAAPIRKALGDTTPEALQLRAAETYSASSIEAAQAYAKGQEKQWDLDYAAAIPFYRKAIQADPEMGRAYAGLAVANSKTDRKEAEKYFQIALSKTARMTEREQYRTRSAYYLFTRNDQKAIEELSTLLKQYPADDAARINLATAYFFTHDFKRAIDEGQRLIAQNPKNVLYRSNVALYSMYAGQFDDAIRGAAEALKLSPTADSPHIAMALSQLALGKTADAEATYRKLEATGKDLSLKAGLGLADLALYEGRSADAARILEHGTGPNSLAALAVARRKGAGAIDAAKGALAASPSPGTAFTAAAVLLENGQEARALEEARKLGARLEPDRRAYAKLIEGEAQLLKGKTQAASDLFLEANKLADTWLGHFDLGRAYIEASAFPEASSEFDICEKRKGEATAVFLDDVPSFRYFPLMYYYQGRVREGLKRTDAGESYKAFIAIKSKGDQNDPLVADALKRTH
jgi:Flp pilus assembly protein TadD